MPDFRGRTGNVRAVRCLNGALRRDLRYSDELPDLLLACDRNRVNR